MTFSNKIYDTLKWIAQYFLPATGTLYFGVSKIWNLPYGAEVVGTITAIVTFLGILLGLSKIGYIGEGTLQIDTTRAKDIYRLDLNTAVEDLAGMKQVTFKVDPNANLDAKSQG